ncbi:Glucosidase 2 subunit beta isoform 3 [Schistosoma japonicum]|nr:Glucosidase 2 subunit beta [Schistosoma japonicum]TNN20728.1 Glucosidase 2 subunit beta isoform 3 [Schistosoma japonicum]CAX74911.1 putative Glucosidase II beta subunit precursor [Schistosoma japonicum]
MQLLRCIFCVLLLIIDKICGGELPRGVPLSRSSFYQVGQLFTCLDGSSAVSWLKVNDDYCDCRDGSDEPGTSACLNGRFFCRDMQYRPVYLPSAYVNDTICDCCDGSDEYGIPGNCPSACGALAASLREAQSIKRNQIEQGHKLFKEYVEDLKERKAKGIFHEEEELKLPEHDVGTNSDNNDETIQANVNVDPQSARNEEHSTSAPSSSVSPNQQSPDDHDNLVEHKESLSNTDHHEENLNEHDHGDVLDDYKQSNDESHQENPSPNEESVVQHRPIRIPIDYGPEEGFRMLTELPDGCLDLDDREYTYSLCPFKSVHQKLLGSSKSDPGTSIGIWSRWLESDENEKSYKVMLYENGLHCWNGPARSTKVFVHCGDSNQLTAVSEPSRCEYVMQLITPAACYEDPNELFRRMHPEL